MARAQPKPDSSDAADPDRPNAATRALNSSPSDCCGEPTRLETLDKAKQQFDIELRKRLEATGYDGDEIVAVCPDCKNAVALICR
ncbi:hypothetical protein [Natrinema thermotolerans]